MAKDQSGSNYLPLPSSGSSPGIERHSSAWQGEHSNMILDAVESRDHVKLREVLSSVSADSATIVLAPSTLAIHRMRTPLMAASDSGDLAIFTTIAHAVDRAIIRRVVLDQVMLKKEQLKYRDSSGMTVLILAARSGNVGILEAVINRIRNAKGPESGTGPQPTDGAQERLLDCDHGGKSVLMHAVGMAGSAAFRIILEEIHASFPEMVERQLLTTCGSDRTILMHAARCGDQTGVLSATYACRRFITHSKMTELITEVDNYGVTFLMHAIRASAESTSAERSSVPRGPRNGLHTSDEETADVDGARSDDGLVSTAKAGPGLADGGKDPGPAILSAAWVLIKDVLWKQQVREQLMAVDSCGRSIFVHAVQTGRESVFDAVFYVARAHLLDDEIDVLMGIDKDDNTHTEMEKALMGAPSAMASTVRKRHEALKRDITLEERASTIESKIQSFIPGKLVVIFQLLLSEVSSGSKGLILLIVMSAIAPFLSWAGSLVAREKPSSTEKRRSPMSLFLSAPAMFFWGLGTSEISQSSGMGWNPTTSATALAVATIVIPSIDSFFASRRVEQWYDEWSCQRWRFMRRAQVAWEEEQDRLTEADPRATGLSHMRGPIER